jgi:hypothetical protein
MVRDILSLLVITIQYFLYLYKVGVLNAFSIYKVEVEKQKQNKGSHDRKIWYRQIVLW